MPALWIGIHLPLLPLEAFAAGRPPAPQGRALLAQHRIALADAQAQALGVRPGLKRATALALAPALVLGQADAAREAAALRALVHAALAFTPMVATDAAIDDPAGAPIDAPGAAPAGSPPGAAAAGLRLEVSACLRLFGGLPRLAQRLVQALAPLGHELSLASGPTPLGAALRARWQGSADPAALAVPPRGAAWGALLDQAPLALLPAAAAQADALQAMGLRTLGELRRLPRAGLARRLGPALLLELDRARGDVPDPQRAQVLPPQYAERIELHMRADDAAQLGHGAALLLHRLVAWAQGRQGRIARCTLRLHHEPRHRHGEDLPPYTDLPLALAEPSIDAAHLQALLAERLARLVLPAPVLELALHCTELAPGAAPSGELFPSAQGRREGLARLLERLRARLGDAQVRAPSLAADHRPEQALIQPAFALAGPAAATGAAGRGRPANAGPGSTPAGPDTVAPSPALCRPVWLLRQPQPLPERGLRPWLDGAPLQIAAGPERLESGWWDDALAARDYFIAMAADGSLVWIYRERLPRDGSGWFLQGRFA